MKICVLKESLCLGGTERSAANISRVLARDHQVYMTVYDGTKLEYPYGGELVDLKLPPREGTLGKVLNTLQRALKYKRLISREKMDILFEFVSINSPISAMTHRNCVRLISSRDFSVLKACTDQFHKCLSHADGLICNSDYLRQYYTACHPEHKDKVFTVYNVIDTAQIREQGKGDADPDFLGFLEAHPKTVVSVGRFCKEKGFEFLLEALAQAGKQVPELGLVLVGDGEFREKYQQIIREKHLKNQVYFTGFQRNPYQYMAKCSCFVLSSLSEGFPNVLAEAMALEKPVIATNCLTGPAEILRKDQNYEAVTDRYARCDYGILTPDLNQYGEAAVSELARAIVDLTGDAEMMGELSQAALQRAGDFTAQAAGEKLNGIFGTLLRRKQKN